MVVSPAQYTIKVRDNNNNFVGEIDAFNKFEMIDRYNNYGSWQIQLADDHPMAPYLATPGYGIYVLRNGAYYFSGPTRYIERDGIDSNTSILAGYDDTWLLSSRLAYPITNTSYSDFISLNFVIRGYTFGDTSGTTAVDFTGTANGTYHGGFTLNQASLVDDPHGAVALNGTTGYVSVPTTSLPTGNSAFALMKWINYTGAPSGTTVEAFIGTVSTASSAYMGILASGKPTMQLKGANTNAANALSVGVHCMILDYDGTTAKLWVDGIVVATATPGACTLAYGTASFGAYGAGASNFSPYTMQFGCIFQGHLGNASLPGSTLDGQPWPLVLYLEGLSRFASLEFDAESGPAESVIKTYVQYNCISGSADTDRAIPNMTLEADAAQGSDVSYNARFERLISSDYGGLLQVLANSGGVGFKVVQSGTDLEFQVYVPTTSSKAKFSYDLGNLGSYKYINDSQGLVNCYVVGGGGTANDRAFLIQSDPTSVSSWGGYEDFLNAGSTTDRTQLANQATDAINNNASKLTFNGVFYETDGLQFIRDFNLGDTVYVTVDGSTLTDICRSVDILLDNDDEALTIGIGTPSSGQIVAAMQRYEAMASGLNTRLARLERV